MLMGTILKELQEKNLVIPELASLSAKVRPPSTIPDSEPRAGLIITGKTLEFALQEGLQKQFLELTACCQAVVCCRATPLQKSEVVKLVRNHLRVMTLAIGEWGEDPSRSGFKVTLGSMLLSVPFLSVCMSFSLCFPLFFLPTLPRAFLFSSGIYLVSHLF